jgi:uncharacterized protein (TIGR02466 family)
MSTRDIFPVTIYETKFDNFEEIQSEIIEAVRPLFNNNIASGNQYFDKDGNPIFVRTEPNLQGVEELKPVTDFIEHHAKVYWEALNLTNKIDPYVMQMWANDVPPGGFTPAHTHIPVPVGGVFYVEADPKMGNLYLEDPLETTRGQMPYDHQYRPYLPVEEIKVETGKLVIFPGWLRHHVRSNTSEKNRLIIGFNIGSWRQWLPKP